MQLEPKPTAMRGRTGKGLTCYADLCCFTACASIPGLTPSNLHLTLAFIGMWPEDISGLLPSVQNPFPVTLSHLGIFPGAKVLWAGVEPSEALDNLARQVRQALTKAEIPFDRQDFNPHITLARKPAVPEHVRLSEIEVPQATMIVKDVCLYRSDHFENGMEYTVIGRSKRPGE